MNNKTLGIIIIVFGGLVLYSKQEYAWIVSAISIGIGSGIFFWKDKEIVKTQIKNWPLKNIQNIIIKINEVELLIKKNSSNSLNILSDFVIAQASKSNN